MNDVHALGKLCCYWEEGQEPVTKSSRMRGESDGLSRKGRGSFCTQPARALWALPGWGADSASRPLPAQPSATRRLGQGREWARARARAAAELRPIFLSFSGRRRPLAAAILPRPRTAPAPPAPPPAPPPCGDPGGWWGGAGAQTQRPKLGAARNALKRRERGRESAAPESESELKLPAGGEEERGEDEEERGEAQARRRRGWDPGRAHFSAKCQLPGTECRARTFWAPGKSQREFEILGKKVGFPPSPFPCY